MSLLGPSPTPNPLGLRRSCRTTGTEKTGEPLGLPGALGVLAQDQAPQAVCELDHWSTGVH